MSHLTIVFQLIGLWGAESNDTLGDGVRFPFRAIAILT